MFCNGFNISFSLQTHHTVQIHTVQTARRGEKGRKVGRVSCASIMDYGSFPQTGEGPILILFEICGRAEFLSEIRQKIVHLISTPLFSYSPKASSNSSKSKRIWGSVIGISFEILFSVSPARVVISHSSHSDSSFFVSARIPPGKC